MSHDISQCLEAEEKIKRLEARVKELEAEKEDAIQIAADRVTRLEAKLAIYKSEMSSAQIVHAEAAIREGKEERCPVCHWPLAKSVEEGCVIGNCSMRPRPQPPRDGEEA